MLVNNNGTDNRVVSMVKVRVKKKKTHTQSDRKKKYSPFLTSSFLIRPTGSTKKTKIKNQNENYDQSAR